MACHRKPLSRLEFAQRAPGRLVEFSVRVAGVESQRAELGFDQRAARLVKAEILLGLGGGLVGLLSVRLRPECGDPGLGLAGERAVRSGVEIFPV